MASPDDELSEVEREAFVGAVVAVRDATLRALRGPGAPPARQAVVWLQQGLAQRWQQASERRVRSGTPLACASGCSACCHSRVEVSRVEAQVLTEAILRQPDAWKQRVGARLAAGAVASESEPDRPRKPGWGAACVLLEADGHCGLYESRPAVCRKAHSLNASACRDASPRIPQDLTLLLDAEALIQGVEAAMRELGGGGQPLELTAVVQAALPPGPGS